MGLLRRLAIMLLTGLALTGCTLGSPDSGNDSAESMTEGAQHESADGVAADPATTDRSTTDREVITTGSLTLRVDDALTAAEETVRIVEDAGGRVDERSRQAADDVPRAWLTVRVPADDLTATLERIEALGEVEDLTLSAQDVTRQTQDLDARITALQTSVDRLLDLMAEADTSEALIAAEEALSRRQADLEALQSERAYLADQVTMSTVHVSLVTASDARLEPGGFLGGIAQGWDALVAAASGLLVVLGVLLPWLAVLGVPALLALWLVRRRRARHSPRPDDQAPDVSDA